MGSKGPSDVPMSGANETEDSVEIKIKTLDSQTYTLRVNKFVPVPALKDQIATVTGVLSEQQRLICRGRVLRDDQLLSAYHVEDGHTLHLVSRPPMSSSSTPSAAAGASEGAAGHEGLPFDNPSNGTSHSFVFEAVNVDQGDRSNPTLGRFISSLLHSIISGTASPGNSRADSREMNSNAGHSDATHPQPTSASRVEFDTRQSAFRVPSTANMGIQHPPVITDSMTTIHQYVQHMRDEFRRETSRYGGELHGNTESSGMNVNGGGNHSVEARPVSLQGGLPSPTALAEILLSARELLTEEAGGRLLQLARQLENQASETDPLVRTNIQSSAVRSGLLIQNLGALLLELGRTTMTLHMGQTPTEAVVNAGPAVFISASGPNPLMVQPVPFYPGSSFAGLHTGTANLGSGHEGQPLDSAYVPRNIEIEIHTGRRISRATPNPGEQTDAQQTQEHTDSARNSPMPDFITRAFSGGLGGASLTSEPGVRVVPVRTVVAVPARVGRSASDSSGRPTGVFVPLFARIQQQSTGGDARGSQSSSGPNSVGPENGQQPTRESSMPTTDGIPLSGSQTPAVSFMSATTGDLPQYQGTSRVFMSSQSLPINNSVSAPPLDGEQAGQGSVDQMLSQFDQWIRNVLTREGGNASGNGHQDPIIESATNQSGPTRNSETQGSSVVGEEAIFFSNLVRQLMPHISSQHTDTSSEIPPATTTTASFEESPAEPSSSQHDRDPAEPPSPKRSKRN